MADILIDTIVDRIRDIDQSGKMKDGWRTNQSNDLFSNSPYAYVAYETALRMDRSHKQYSNKQEFREAFQVFESKSDRHRRRVIRQWGEVLRNDTGIVKKIGGWLGLGGENRPPRARQNAQQPRRRQPRGRRPGNATSYGLRSRERRRPGASSQEPEAEVEDAPVSHQPSPAASHAPANGGQSQLPAFLSPTRIEGWEEGRELIDIPMQAINRLVPRRLYSSIERKLHSRQPDLHVAAVDLEFGSKEDQPKCRMTFYITKNATARYAAALFGVHIEERNKVYFIRDEGSCARITGMPQLQLSDCHRKCLDREFGRRVANAIKQSRRCKIEDAKFKLLTQSVCMYIPFNLEKEKEQARIEVELGSDEGWTIMEELKRQEDEDGGDDADADADDDEEEEEEEEEGGDDRGQGESEEEDE